MSKYDGLISGLSSLVEHLTLLDKKVALLEAENAKLRQEIRGKASCGGGCSGQSCAYLWSKRLKEAVKNVIFWQRALEEGLILYHFRDYACCFENAPYSFDEVSDVIYDGYEVDRFFGMPSVKRVQSIASSLTFRRLLNRAGTCTSNDAINIQYIATLMQTLAQYKFQDEDAKLYNDLVDVHNAISSQAFHVKLTELYNNNGY